MQRKNLGCGSVAVLLIGGLLIIGVISATAQSVKDAVFGKSPTTEPSSGGVPVSEVSSRLESCVTDSFGGGGDPRYAATWYTFIKGYRVAGDSVYVATSLFHKDENRPDAEHIRGAVYSCIRSANLPLRSVYVRASNDVNLAFGSVPGK